MSEPRRIRKYPNRRLYDTREGRFINLEDLRRLVLAGEDFVVEDKATGADITRSLLLQVIVEAEESGEPLLPTRVLKQMIRFYGNVMQSAFGTYIEAAIEQFLAQQETVEKQLSQLMKGGPVAAMNEMLRQQMAFFGKMGRGNDDDKGR